MFQDDGWLSWAYGDESEGDSGAEVPDRELFTRH